MATLGEYLGAGSSTTKLLLHLNGNSTDSSGNGNNGTSTNITYSQANGKFGQGAGFNGSSSKIKVPNNILGGATAMTLSCWVNLVTHASQISAGDGRTVFRDDGEDVLLRASYGDTGGNDRGPEFGITTNTGYTFIYVSPRTYIPLNTWCNLIGTYDGSNIKIYYDGKLIATQAKTGTISSTAGSAFWGCSNSSAYFFNGAMEECILENVAWSAEKVKKYYTMTKGRFGIL